MNPDRYDRLRELFLGAQRLEPAERRAFLEDACPDDASLVEDVEGLLRNQELASRFLESPALGEGFALGEPGELGEAESGAPRRIGGYAVGRLLGRGGFGEVYEAEQLEPVRRSVALKMIRPGMDSRHVLARFEAERQALAVMQHPGIAQVFDAGVTEGGRPWFAMERVPGEPITDYCDRRRLTIGQQLGVFLEVCDAIQHAHQKGVLHRDVKPSNVLVSEHVVSEKGGRHRIKIIDFGVAKALDRSWSADSAFTVDGQVLGTPGYMSPEQAEGAGDVDTRSDVYSLGALLYELLVGTPPFEAGALREAGFAEVQRILRDVDPPKPTTRLSASKEESTAVARSRATDSRSLARELRGDLEWITMRALEKDRARRYAAVSELAADVRRHLHHEPVLAGPPSAAYRASKFLRRHRVLAASALLVIVSGGTGLGLALWQADVAAAERDHAQEQAKVKTAIVWYLVRVLGEADPITGEGRDARVVDALDRAATELPGAFPNEPLVEAGVRAVLGDLYGRLGSLPQAEGHLEWAHARWREHGIVHRDSLATATSLALVRKFQGRFAEAEELFRTSLEESRATLGEEDRLTIVLREGVAQMAFHQGRYAEAEEELRAVLVLRRRVFGPEDPESLNAVNNLASALSEGGKHEEAARIRMEVLGTLERVSGPEHPHTVAVRLNLGTYLVDRGDCEEGRDHLHAAMRGMSASLGATHPKTQEVRRLLAQGLVKCERLDAAEAVYRELVHLETGVHGTDHRSTLEAKVRLADVLGRQRRFAEARGLLDGVLADQRLRFGEEHEDTLRTLDLLDRLERAAEPAEGDG